MSKWEKEVVDWWGKSGTLPQSKVKYLMIVIMQKVNIEQ